MTTCSLLVLETGAQALPTNSGDARLRHPRLMGEDLASHERRGRFRETMALAGCSGRKPGLEVDLAMGEREQAPGISGEKPGHGPDVLDEAREAGLMREVLRTQEQHREGGVEPELEMDEEPRPEA